MSLFISLRSKSKFHAKYRKSLFLYLPDSIISSLSSLHTSDTTRFAIFEHTITLPLGTFEITVFLFQNAPLQDTHPQGLLPYFLHDLCSLFHSSEWPFLTTSNQRPPPPTHSSLCHSCTLSPCHLPPPNILILFSVSPHQNISSLKAEMHLFVLLPYHQVQNCTWHIYEINKYLLNEYSLKTDRR